MVKNEKGRMEMVWLPTGLYDIVEETRKKLGMNKSSFYRYAIVRLLEELNVLSATVHEWRESQLTKEEESKF